MAGRYVKQISIFLENKKGRLAMVARTLAEKGINIRALSIADTSDFGILRLIVNQPQQAYEYLKEKGFTTSMTAVIAAQVPDVPGGLSHLLDILEQEEINLEYMYAFIGRNGDNALNILRVEDGDRAVVALEKNGIKVFCGEEVYQM